jgi:hypothetical protein
MNAFRVLRSAIVVGIAIGLCPSARAATVLNLTYIGQDATTKTSNALTVNLYSAINGSGVGSGSVAAPHVSQGGGFDWTIPATGPNSAANDGNLTFVGYSPLGQGSPTHLLTFCIELTQHVASDPTTNVVNLSQAPQPASGPIGGSGMGTTAANLIMQLWTDDFGKVVQPSGNTNPITNLPLTQSDAVAAFQLAIWKLEYDGNDVYGTPGNVNFSFGKGYLEANTSDPVTKLAANWINAINPTDPLANLFALTGGPNTNFQDQVFAEIPPVGQHGVPTPEPGSCAIWFALGSMAYVLKMRRRKGASAAA